MPAAAPRSLAAFGVDEAVAWRLTSLGPHRIAVGTFDFSFRGGTLGVIAGDRLVELAAAARQERVPLFLEVRTGGVRVDEGPAALSQMPRVAHAFEQHRRAGLLQVTTLRDPSFGGVPAGFALAADVIVGTPGARTGFLGPPVVRALGQTPARGGPEPLADVVLPEAEQAEWIARLLDVLAGQPGPLAPVVVGTASLDRAVDGLVVLAGCRRGVPRPGATVGLASVAGRPVAWVALSERDDPGPPGPAAYAAVRQHLLLAERLGLPVVALVATGGADPSATADRANIAGEIAATTTCFASLAVPTSALVTGRATSGGAMALMGADRVVIDRKATVDVLPPAGLAGLHQRAKDESGGAGAAPPRSGAHEVVADGVADAADDLADPERLRAELVALASELKAGARLDRWTAAARRWQPIRGEVTRTDGTSVDVAPVRAPAVYEVVVAQLRALVRDGTVAVGDRLPGERDLAVALAVSRSSLRRAVAELVEAGALEVRHGSGTYVLAQEGAADALARTLADQNADLPALMEARRAVEVELASLAAERRTEADLTAIRRGLARMEEEVRQGRRGAEGDAMFHHAVWVAAHSPALEAMTRAMAADITRLREESLAQPDRPTRSLRAHALVLAAIGVGDPWAARAAMRAHLDEVRDTVLGRLSDRPGTQR